MTFAIPSALLSREQVENIVRHSYQHVAMFNVIQKFALDPGSSAMFTNGINKPKAMTARVRLSARGLRGGGKEAQAI
jgi:hypothetical protein